VGILSRVLTALRFGRRATALAADAPTVGPLTKRIHGLSAGDWLWAQKAAERLYGPFNPASVSDSTLKIMTRDWTLGFSREIWASSFFAVDYRMEGGDPRIRAFVDEIVQRHIGQWLETVLRALDYGRQACELVWSVEDVAFRYAAAQAPGEGDQTEDVLRRAYVLGELRDLDPEKVEIIADGRTGDYTGLRYEGVELPGGKTLLVVNEPEFGGLLGRSLNVRAYNPWWWGNLVYLGLNRYLERKGDPPLIGFAPGEEVADARGNSQDPVHVTATGLANLKSGGAYVFPQEFDPDSKQPLYAVRALEVAERAPEFLSTIDRYEHNKKVAWLIPGSLGSGASFASDKVSQQLLHRMFDRRLRRLVLDPLNLHVVPKLVRYNFGDVPASAYPRLAAGSMAENAREVFAELLRSALSLEAIAPDGRAVRIAQMIDWAKGLRTLNLPKVDTSLIPDAAEAQGDGLPTAGRPPRITRESDRPNAPSRPGLARALPLASTPETGTTWLDGVLAGLGRIDEVVAVTERLVEHERVSVEAEIRNLYAKAVARAKKSDGRLDARNRTLAAELSQQVESMLEQSMFGDLLDESEITPGALGLARGPKTPLAAQHGKAFEAAAGTIEAAGVSAPGRVAGVRIVKDVVRDAKSNGRGVVTRETRRVSEELDRMIMAEAPAADAEAAADRYELRERDYKASTVDHVRATARATLTHSGAQAEADAWAVLAGPSSEATILERFPRGQVAEQLYTAKSTADLDAMYRRIVVDDARPGTSWRNLGMVFGSPEYYVPIPKGTSALSIIALLEAKRREWGRRREERQRELDALRSSGSTDTA